MIVSFIEGRVRLRHPIFQDTKVVEQISSMLQSYSGVNQVSTNLRTGSILIEYDTAIISKEDLLVASQAFEQQFLADPDFASSLSETETIIDEEEAIVIQKLQEILAQARTALKKDSGILLIMLLSSVASGFLGLKKWHVVIGSTFAAFAMRHFGNRRPKR